VHSCESERTAIDPVRDAVVDPASDELSWRRLFDALPYAIALVDSSGVIRYANGHLADLSGYESDELLGTDVDMLVPGPSRPRHAARRRQLAAAPAIRPHGTRPDLELLRRDGSEVAVDIALAPVTVENAQYTITMIRDDSDRRAAECARVEAERRFRLVFENNVAGMAVSDLDGRLLDVNRAYCSMLGVDEADLLGHNLLELTHPDDRIVSIDAHRRLIAGEVEHANVRKRYAHSDGHVVEADVLLGVIRDDGSVPLYLVASTKDVTAEHALAAQLSHQALHDPLTGLANRSLFEERIAQASASLHDQDRRCVVMALDLDDFTAVNDALGHHAGDQLLVELAERLAGATRPGDTLCRPGGDEFLYLAGGLSSGDEVDEVACRLLGALAEPFHLGGTRLDQRASLGIAIGDGGDCDKLLKRADAALFEAKRQGKGRSVTFAPEMGERVSSRFALCQELRHALPSGELSMHYQPLVELATGRVVGFEALMRWHQRRRGNVRPDVFIPLAEESGLISELGRFALREAGAAAAQWHPPAGMSHGPYVSVNLSVHQFHDPGLLSIVEDALAASALPPERLVLEITESAALADVAGAARVVGELRSLGVALALDDFGTGYSSLSYLAKLQPTIIKIDRSFVSPSADSAYAESLLAAIVSLGHELDMVVLAEGIETVEQLGRLRRLECDVGQGYLFSAAVPACDVAGVLARGPFRLEAAQS